MIDNIAPEQDARALPEKEWITTAEWAAESNISESSWNKRRLTGNGPPFAKIGKSVRYHRPTARAWIAERQRRSTSDTAPAA